MYIKAPVLKDPQLQREFDKNGFVKIKILTDGEADELYRFYLSKSKEHEVITNKYRSTTHTNDPHLITEIDNYLKEKICGKLPLHFQNYEVMIGTYITKEPGEGSDTGLHQDPTFVDEEKYVSGNLWLALHDINHENGNLFFLKGSHRMIPGLRVTPACPTAFDKVRDIMAEYITEVEVRKGEAIFINHAVVHGATNNLSQGPRVAAVLALRSASSNWIYYYLKPGATFDNIEKYEVDVDTFIHLKKDGWPEKAKLLGTVKWDFPMIERDEFISRMKKNNSGPLLSIFKKWREMAGV